MMLREPAVREGEQRPRLGVADGRREGLVRGLDVARRLRVVEHVLAVRGRVVRAREVVDPVLVVDPAVVGAEVRRRDDDAAKVAEDEDPELGMHGALFQAPPHRLRRAVVVELRVHDGERPVRARGVHRRRVLGVVVLVDDDDLARREHARRAAEHVREELVVAAVGREERALDRRRVPQELVGGHGPRAARRVARALLVADLRRELVEEEAVADEIALRRRRRRRRRRVLGRERAVGVVGAAVRGVGRAAVVELGVDLGDHAARRGPEGELRDAVEELRAVAEVAIEGRGDVADAPGQLEAVVEADQAVVAGVGLEAVLVHEQEPRRADGQPRAAPRLRRHHRPRALALEAGPGLEAAALGHVALAALVVVPAAPRRQVVERLVAQMDRRAAVEERDRARDAAGARLERQRRVDHGDAERVRVRRVLGQGRAPPALVVLFGQRRARKAVRHNMMFGGLARRGGSGLGPRAGRPSVQRVRRRRLPA
mmetsp:Transcript_17087/g.58906  ORF Transcript_17087/g.58906 Transcript_17087/m.58906 type:complete len:486 (+) Transcript_17087:1028-2485(+)